MKNLGGMGGEFGGEGVFVGVLVVLGKKGRLGEVLGKVYRHNILNKNFTNAFLWGIIN